MKNIVIIAILTCLFTVGYGQQTPSVNDSQLLDYYQNQRFADAAAYLKTNYPEPVTDNKILAKLAYTSQMAGKLVDAEGYYQRIYNNDSTNTTVLFNLGAISLRRGDDRKAEIFYKKILQHDTTNFMVYKQLAKINADKGEAIATLNFLIKANKLNPDEADVASDLSDMFVNFKQYELAQKVLTKAIAADQENNLLLLSLLRLDLSEEKWADAKNVCLTLMQLGDRSAYLLTKLGTVYYNLKDNTCCVETLADIPAPEQGETSFYISALAYKELKDQRSAIENLAKAISAGISPNIADYYSEVGNSYEWLMKYKKAVTAYQKGLQFEEKPITYYLLATVYDTELKNKKQAVLYYKKYLAAKPPAKEVRYKTFASARIKQLVH